MGALRKLKREKIKPQLKEAKKIAADYVRKDNLARRATIAQERKINTQTTARINTSAFIVLHKEFGLSYHKLAWLSEHVKFTADCLTTNEPGTNNPFLTYDMIKKILKLELDWDFPKREIESKPRLEMTAAEMADNDAKHFINEGKMKLELMWLIVLRDKAGFARVRLERFLDRLRITEEALTAEQAIQVNEALKKQGIEFEGFDTGIFSQVKFFAA